MRTALIRPYSAEEKFEFQEPLGAEALCGFLRQNHQECRVFDRQLDRMLGRSTLDAVNAYDPDVIGFSLMTEDEAWDALRLLQLPEPVIELLKSGALSAGHGRALAGLTDKAQIEKLAAECVEKEYSVRVLEEKIKQLAEKKKPASDAKKEKPARSAELSSLEESFREALGTRVSLAGSNTRGKITIEYYSREDLERVYDKLTGRD